MRLQLEHEAKLKSYLLGELRQEERARIESRLFAEGDYFEELQATEDDLIDDYLYEDLSTDERHKFESQFLSTPQRRQDLRIAKALKQYIAAEAQPKAAVVPPDGFRKRLAKFLFFPLPYNSLARLSLAAIILIALAGIIWLVVATMHRQNQSTPQQARQPTIKTTDEQPSVARDNQSGNLPQQRDNPPEQPQHSPKVKEARNSKEAVAVANPSPSQPHKESPARSLAILLSPGGLVRGSGDTNRVILSPHVRSLTLRLPMVYTDKYRSYFARLQTRSGTLRTWKALKIAAGETGKEILLKVRAKILRPQTYYIRLGGTDANGEARDIGTYTFIIERRESNSGNGPRVR